MATIGAAGPGPAHGLQPPALADDEPDDDDPLANACAIHLTELGCGYYHRLVLEGPHAGEVWADYRGADAGVTCEGAEFLAWYDAWIDDALSAWLELIAARAVGNGPWTPPALFTRACAAIAPSAANLRDQHRDGVIALALGDAAAARRAFTAHAAGAPDSVRGPIGLAWSALAAGDPATALAAVADARARAPTYLGDRAAIARVAARAHWLAGRADAALDEARAARGFHAYADLPTLDLGALLHTLGRTTELEALIAEAVAGPYLFVEGSSSQYLLPSEMPAAARTVALTAAIAAAARDLPRP